MATTVELLRLPDHRLLTPPTVKEVIQRLRDGLHEPLQNLLETEGHRDFSPPLQAGVVALLALEKEHGAHGAGAEFMRENKIYSSALKRWRDDFSADGKNTATLVRECLGGLGQAPAPGSSPAQPGRAAMEARLLELRRIAAERAQSGSTAPSSPSEGRSAAESAESGPSAETILIAGVDATTLRGEVKASVAHATDPSKERQGYPDWVKAGIVLLYQHRGEQSVKDLGGTLGVEPSRIYAYAKDREFEGKRPTSLLKKYRQGAEVSSLEVSQDTPHPTTRQRRGADEHVDEGRRAQAAQRRNERPPTSTRRSREVQRTSEQLRQILNATRAVIERTFPKKVEGVSRADVKSEEYKPVVLFSRVAAALRAQGEEANLRELLDMQQIASSTLSKWRQKVDHLSMEQLIIEVLGSAPSTSDTGAARGASETVGPVAPSVPPATAQTPRGPETIVQQGIPLPAAAAQEKPTLHALVPTLHPATPTDVAQDTEFAVQVLMSHKSGDGKVTRLGLNLQTDDPAILQKLIGVATAKSPSQ